MFRAGRGCPSRVEHVHFLPPARACQLCMLPVCGTLWPSAVGLLSDCAIHEIFERFRRIFLDEASRPRITGPRAPVVFSFSPLPQSARPPRCKPSCSCRVQQQQASASAANTRDHPVTEAAMYLARAQASKRFLSGAAAGCPAASRNASKLPALGTERLSASSAVASHARPLSTIHARGPGGLLPTAARWPAKSVAEARSARLLARDQQTRSLGLFSGGGGGISHQRLKELEKMAAQSPSDANAEVCYDVEMTC